MKPEAVGVWRGPMSPTHRPYFCSARCSKGVIINTNILTPIKGLFIARSEKIKAATVRLKLIVTRWQLLQYPVSHGC